MYVADLANAVRRASESSIYSLHRCRTHTLRIEAHWGFTW